MRPAVWVRVLVLLVTCAPSCACIHMQLCMCSMYMGRVLVCVHACMRANRRDKHKSSVIRGLCWNAPRCLGACVGVAGDVCT